MSNPACCCEDFIRAANQRDELLAAAKGWASYCKPYREEWLSDEAFHAAEVAFVAFEAAIAKAEGK